MSNLVIVVQRFSPYNKVGARRWSKFVHYLQNYSDLNITVITQKHNNLSADPWNIDLRSDKIKVEYVNDPLAVIASSLNIFKRLSDFFRYKVFKHTDEGYGFSKRAFLHLEKNEQRLMPDVVIASSPSYSTCYFAAKYRKKNSKIKLINDYRDAWIDGFFSWNKNLTSTDDIYQKQKEMELFSLNNCDAIVSVTPELLDKLKYKVKDKNIDCVLITNGFDKRDLDSSEYPYPVEFNKNDINICHFGTLDFGREDEFMKFISTNEISERIKFYLIGSLNVKLRETIVNFKNVIHIPYLQPALIKPYLYHADFHLAVNDVEFYYAYGSKIFDAMLYSKPFIFVSKENSLVEKYRENPYFLHTDNSAISNKKIFESIVSNKHLNVSKPDYSEFDLEHLTNKYYQLINMQLNKNATATI